MEELGGRDAVAGDHLEGQGQDGDRGRRGFMKRSASATPTAAAIEITPGTQSTARVKMVAPSGKKNAGKKAAMKNVKA